jgi:serine/threonine protein kinase
VVTEIHLSNYYLNKCSSYGSVWEAQKRSTGQIVAIKRVPIENDYEDLLKEIDRKLLL